MLPFRWHYGLILLIATAYTTMGQQAPPPSQSDSDHIRQGSRIFIEEMGGFEDYLTAAFYAKRVPVVIVTDKDKADFVFSGSARSNGKQQQATVKAVNRRGVVVYAFAFHDDYALHGKRSAAEACAKDLNKEIFNH